MEQLEQARGAGKVYDYRDYDRIWQRVSPTLAAYPAEGSEPAPPGQQLAPAQEEQLPGAQEDPCCMGSAAGDMLEVIAGYIHNELEGQRSYRMFARCCSGQMARVLRELAVEEAAHARRLQAVYYLISGRCCRPLLQGGCMQLGSRCEELRRRYHDESCDAINYLRSAEGTTDPCLQDVFHQLSREEFSHAQRLLQLLINRGG